MEKAHERRSRPITNDGSPVCPNSGFLRTTPRIANRIHVDRIAGNRVRLSAPDQYRLDEIIDADYHVVTDQAESYYFARTNVRCVDEGPQRGHLSGARN